MNRRMCTARSSRTPFAALLVASSVLLGAACPASAAPNLRVSAGAMTAQLARSPWSMTFAQRSGQTLREQGGAPGGPNGPLAFATAAGWFHATKVLSSRREGDAVVVSVATNDPLGRTLSVRVAPVGDGVIAVRAAVTGVTTADVSSMGVGFSASPSERFYGFGERSTGLDQRGADVENYVSDGPFSPDTRAFVAATIPPQGYRARDDATYYPIPWVLSSRGYGFLLDNDETSTFHLASMDPGAWSVEAQTRTLAFRVFAGPTPAEALRRFTAVTGRQPPPTAPWQFGPWFQTGQPNTVPLADEAAWLQKLRRADAPVSAAETQLRYLPCGLDRGNEDYEANRVAFFHQHGLAILTYVNPMVCASYQPLYNEALAAGALQRNAAGGPDAFNSFVGGTGPAGFTVQPVSEFDFTSPAGEAIYAGVLRKVLAAGHDGWMEDFGEYTPIDTRPRDGTTAAQMHNRYPVTYHCAVADLLKRGLSPRPIVRFQRSGWTGAARCASDVWGGDPTTTFGFDGLSSAIKQALSMGLSGVSRWGSDIGGYDTLGNDPKLTPELLQRWIEFGAVSGVMRTKASGLAVPSYQRPEIWDPGIVRVWRRYAKLHTQLYPYIAAADTSYRATGMPLMRALILLSPADPRAQAVDDEFGFGPDLLAAPVIVAGARQRTVYLPRGRWISWNRSVRYDQRTGSFDLSGARSITGGRSVTAPAALDELPLYIRAGAILPLLSADVSTLSSYGRGIVHLGDRLGRLRLLAFPSGHSTSRAFTRDRFTSVVRAGGWSLTLHGSRMRHYHLEASTAGLRSARAHAAFRPCRVTLAGRRVHWRFDRRQRLLIVDFAARSATLEVTEVGRCGSIR